MDSPLIGVEVPTQVATAYPKSPNTLISLIVSVILKIKPFLKREGMRNYFKTWYSKTIHLYKEFYFFNYAINTRYKPTPVKKALIVKISEHTKR